MTRTLVQKEMESLQGFLVRAYRIARIGDVVVRKTHYGTVADSHRRIDARRNNGSAWKTYTYNITEVK